MTRMADDTAPNGTAPNGKAPDGTAPDGTAPDGTAPSLHPPADRALELLVGRMLQVGVLVSAVVVAVGLAVLLARGGAAPVSFDVFRGEASALRSVRGVVRGALTLDGGALVQLGLVLLVATPVARVALTLVAFLRQGDRLYVGLTAFVLAILLFGLLGGGA